MNDDVPAPLKDAYASMLRGARMAWDISEDTHRDLMRRGLAITKVNEDGTVERIDPCDFYIDRKPTASSPE